MILYAPFRSAQDMEALTSDSIELSQMLEPSATWKTKFQPHQSWLKILKKADWMTRLFGPISKRLTLARSSEELMQLLAGTLASRFPLQESEAEPMTPGTCGHTSQNSLELFSRGSVSSKTSGGTFDWDCQKCLENSDLLATELGRAYSQRRKSALRTGESACLSWGSPRVTTNGGNGKDRGENRSRIEDQVHQWPTARAGDGKHGGPNQRDGSGSAHLSSAVLWPTASARDYKDTPGMSPEATNPDGSRRDRTDRLPMAVYWMTPEALNQDGYQIANGKKYLRLGGQVALARHSANGKSPEQSTGNSTPPGSPS